MYRNDHEATLAKLQAAQRELLGERKRRARAEEHAEQAQLIAQYTNPTATHTRELGRKLARYVVPAVVGGLLMMPLLVHQTGRAQLVERKLAAAMKGARKLADKYARSQALVAKYARMTTRVYVSGRPSWIHAGFAPVLEDLLACRSKHDSKLSGPIYIKGVAHQNTVKQAMVVTTATTLTKACILEVVGRVRFGREDAVKAFNLAVYPSAERPSAVAPTVAPANKTAALPESSTKTAASSRVAAR